jgi:shikimate dehydrogenase
VTIPHKTAIVPLLDAIDDSASNIGAVNTVKISYSYGKPRFTVYNTDDYGFKSSLDLLPHEFNSAYILGTGGASKAVFYALSEPEIEIKFVSRNTKNNHTISYENFNKIKWNGIPLIVNTTPVGMSPNTFEMPSIDLQKIPTNSLIIDLIYNPEITKLMSEANRFNIFAINGMTMLKVQAEKAWEIFTK